MPRFKAEGGGGLVRTIQIQYLLNQMQLSKLSLVNHRSIGLVFHLISPTKHLQEGLLPLISDDHLISSLLKHQPTRFTLLQIHSKLVTTSSVYGTGVRLWNSLLMHYSRGIYPQEAIYLYKQMNQLCCFAPLTNSYTFSFLLKACASCSQLSTGLQLHATVVKKGFEFQVFVHTGILNMYVACGALMNAKQVFDEMPERSSVTWNAIATGLAGWGDLETATWLFDRMPCRDLISWTGLIDGYTCANRPKEAIKLFGRMLVEGLKPSEITVLAMVPSITSLGELVTGTMVHGYCEKQGLRKVDIRLDNSLIDMYAKCGSIESSFKIFNEIVSGRNLVSWTSLISGFAMHGMAKEAVHFFRDMIKQKFVPNTVTFLSLLNACSHGGLVEEGLAFFKSMVYNYGIEPEIKHYGCMIDMLGRAGRLNEAEEMIARLPMEVNAVVWRTLLGGCCKYGELEMGDRVMKKVLETERRYGGDYVILHNILAGISRFDDAQRIRRLMDERNAYKLPGLTLISVKP